MYWMPKRHKTSVASIFMVASKVLHQNSTKFFF